MKILLFILSLSVFLYSCGSQSSQVKKTQEATQVLEVVEKKHILLALGDSLTAGYNLPPDESYPAQLEALINKNGLEYKIINAGVSSDTSKNLLDRIALYDELKPNVIFIAIGANDGLRKLSTQEMQKNISSIIEHLQNTHPKSKIILAGMQMPLNVGLPYASEFQIVYGQVAKKYNLDFFPFLLQDVATVRELNLSDGIHPNKQGYTIIAQNIFTFLEVNELLK